MRHRVTDILARSRSVLSPQTSEDLIEYLVPPSRPAETAETGDRQTQQKVTKSCWVEHAFIINDRGRSQDGSSQSNLILTHIGSGILQPWR